MLLFEVRLLQCSDRFGPSALIQISESNYFNDLFVFFSVFFCSEKVPKKSMPVEVGKTGVPPGKVGIVSRMSLFTGSPVVTQDTSLLPLVGFEPSPGSDALWEDDLDDSVLAAIDMENLGNDMKSEVCL